MKTSGFIGFPNTKMRPVIVPDAFFAELLPLIDDLGELKLTLFCFWLLNEQEGPLRYLRGADLRRDPLLLESLHLPNDLRSAPAALEDALERAVARSTLLRLEIETEIVAGQPLVEDWYFMNTPKGRQAIAQIRQGRLGELRAAVPSEARLKVDRPNIFVLYEQNIGLLTPILADQLRDLEKNYPPDWIVEAFEIAVSRNKRSLRYIAAILRRWETEGKEEDHAAAGQEPAQKRGSDYFPDEYADIILG